MAAMTRLSLTLDPMGISNFHIFFSETAWPNEPKLAKAVSEEKNFRNRPIRNKNCLWWPYLLMDRDEMSNLYRGPPIDASYQDSF
jgi:hypothetical protein